MKITKTYRLMVVSVAALVLTVVSTMPVSAHVLIKDTTGSIGSIFHVTPDDDPVAGESSTLFFDVQKKDLTPQNYRYSLVVQDEAGTTRDVDIAVAGTTIDANYTFPARGVYTIKLNIAPRDTTKPAVEFVYAQRVARGAGGSASEAAYRYPAWVEPAVILSAVGMVVLGIVAVNKRADIVGYSKFTK